MRNLMIALLYTALGAVANPGSADVATASELRTGDMRKLIFHDQPLTIPQTVFMGEDGADMTLAEFEGQYVVLNFWATWCAPCRTEMPHLSALQDALGGDDLSVVTIATGRNPPAGMRRFFEEIEVDNLPLHTDARQALARDMGVLGLPVTIIINPQGQEIARMQGDADWSSDSAFAVMRALIGTGS